MTCRSSSNWRGDVAIAATYDPKHRTTFAIFFGCNKMQKQQIMGRLATTEPGALAHPMLLPGIFAELERKRLTDLLEDTLDKFTLQTGGFSSFDERPQSNLHMSDKEMNEYLDICYESQNLARECKCVKRQLSKIVKFCDDEIRILRVPSKKFIDSLPTISHRQEMLKVNLKIKTRTLEIGDELDNKVDTCGMVLNNTSITMQTVRRQSTPLRRHELIASPADLEPHCPKGCKSKHRHRPGLETRQRADEVNCPADYDISANICRRGTYNPEGLVASADNNLPSPFSACQYSTGHLNMAWYRSIFGSSSSSPFY